MAQPDSGTSRNWWDLVPPVLCPAPLTDPTVQADPEALIGARVILGSPVAGTWLYDQRAVTKIHERDGQTLIGVLSEVDWYRQLRDPTYLAVPASVPIERVFVELPEDPGPGAAPAQPDQSDMLPGGRSVSMVSHPSIPPVRWPRRSDRERFITGARCRLVLRDGVLDGFRVAGEPRRATSDVLNLSGGLEDLNTPPIVATAPVLRESDWYAWSDTGVHPARRFNVQTQLIYLE